MPCRPWLVGLPILLAAGCGETFGEPDALKVFSGPGVQPPSPGSEHAGSGPTVVFAVTKLLLGDTDRDGTPDSKDGWKHLGVDVDGVISDCSGNACEEPFLNQCVPPENGSPAVSFPDGDDGIDNAFGADILPILLGLQADLTRALQKDLADGDFTLLFAIDGLGSDHDYNPLPARFYRGAKLGHPPLFDGTDAWPVARDSISDPNDLRSSTAPFAKSFVVGDTWVSGVGRLTIHLPLIGQRLVLPIEHAVVTMRLSSDRQTATEGTISGVLPLEALPSQVPRFAGLVDKKYCTGAEPEAVEHDIRQVADIMIDGTSGLRGEICSAISIGLGFEARRVTLGAAKADPAPPSPCPP